MSNDIHWKQSVTKNEDVKGDEYFIGWNNNAQEEYIEVRVEPEILLSTPVVNTWMKLVQQYTQMACW